MGQQQFIGQHLGRVAMSASFELPFLSETVSIEDLITPKAQDFAEVLSKGTLPFVHFLECRRSIDDKKIDIVIFEVEIERSQKVVFDIRRKELIAVLFYSDKTILPEVLALRKDFPLAPHLNLRPWNYPKSLCLFDEPPEEILLRWTPLFFIERIRTWLNLTSRGELHREDQSLEPLLLGSTGTLIISESIHDNILKENIIKIGVEPLYYDGEKYTLLAEKIAEKNGESAKIPFIGTSFICPSRSHGIIAQLPTTIAELNSFTSESGLDLRTELRKRLICWQEEKSNSDIMETKLVIIVAFLVTRRKRGPVENVEMWSFFCDKNLQDIGVALGIWQIENGYIGRLIPTDNSYIGDSVKIYPLRLMRSFSRNLATKLSGLTEVYPNKIAIVGVGSLGSQLFLNLLRSGFGEWVLIDDDVFLPHNLARHTLNGYALGKPKVDSLRIIANSIIDGEDIANSIKANVLAPESSEEEIIQEFKESEIIIDAAASVAVSRHLAIDVDSNARRISVFLTPSGLASILIAEDQDRKIPLDSLEMQYYRFIINNPEMSDHLSLSADPIRYSQSCRDVTNRIPQDFVSLHAAVCSQGIRSVIGKHNSIVKIWTIKTPDMAVKPYEFMPSLVKNIKCDTWTINTDEWFLKKVFAARIKKLPNETGGVLIGSYDMDRKIIYVVDSILSPSDSTEWPTVYIRGSKGLEKKIESIKEITQSNLVYVGEWHSHLDDLECSMSKDDREAFAWLREEMTRAGLPALMLIINGRGHFAFYINEIHNAQSGGKKI